MAHDHDHQGHDHNTFPLDNGNWLPDEDPIVWRSPRRAFEALGLPNRARGLFASKPDPKDRALGQPYTKVVAHRSAKVETTPAGPEVYAITVYQVEGWTPELQFVDEDFHKIWEYHDLGEHNELALAHEAAAAWRLERVSDQYPID